MALLTIVAANLGISPRDANLRLFSRQAGGAGSLPIRFDAGSPNPIYAGASSVEVVLNLEGEFDVDLPASNTYDVPQEYALYNGATLLGYFSLPDTGIPALQFSQLRRTTRPVSVPALLSATEPVDPAEGEWWFNTTSNVLSVRHSGAWVTATSIGSGGTTVIYLAKYDISASTGNTIQVAQDTLGRDAIKTFIGPPGQTHTEPTSQGIHVTEGGIYTAELHMDLTIQAASSDGEWGIRLMRTDGSTGAQEVIHDSTTNTIHVDDFANTATTDRKYSLDVQLVMSRFDEDDYLFAEVTFSHSQATTQTLTYDIRGGDIVVRRYEGEQGLAARGVTIAQVNDRIAAVVNPHALRGNFISEEDFDEITRNDIRKSVDVNGISSSGRQIDFYSNDGRTTNQINVPGITVSDEGTVVDVGTLGATQIDFHGSSVTVSRVTDGVARVTITGGTGGGGPTNDDITSLIESNPDVVRSGEFESAMRYKRDLVRGVSFTQGLSLAAGRIPTSPMVGPREEDMFLEVTVAGDAVYRFLQTTLLNLPAVNDSDQLSSGNSITWTGSNSSNEYHIAHASNGEILFAADNIGSYNLTIVADHIDLEGFARRSTSTTVPVGKLGTGTADSTRVLHGDGTWQVAATGGGEDAATWAEDGNTDLVPVAKLGTGTADSTKVLHGDNTWKDASSAGLNQTEVNALINARVQDPAETGNTTRWAKDKVPSDIVYDTPHIEAVIGAFSGTDQTTDSNTIFVQASYVADPSLATLRSIPDSDWVTAQEVGPRVTNVYMAIRVPIGEDTAVQAGQRAFDVTESEVGDFERYTSDTWSRKGTNVQGTQVYYTVRVADLPSGAMYLVREQHELDLDGDLIDADQWRTTLGLVGGVRYTVVSPTVQTTSSAQSKATASIAVTPAADLDDNLYRHGEWHIHIHGTASIVSPGTDPNFGYEQGKANQTDDDRTAEDTAIIFVGGADGLRAATDRTGGIGAGGGGIRAKRRPVYSLNTLLGYDVVILNRDSQNTVGVIGYFETAGGNALNYNFVNRVQIVYHPSDAPTLESLSGLTQAEVDARVRAGVADWAEAGNNDVLPDAKISSNIARANTVPSNSRIDSRARALIADWAESDNNISNVPASKLGSGTADSTKVLYGDSTWKDAPSGGGGGLNQSQVDARVGALVENFAEVGNNAQIPDSKIPSSIARDSEIPSNSAIDGRARALIADWAEQGNASDIPDSKIPSSIARDSEVPSNSAIDGRANARVNALVENFAKVGNNTRVQTAKLGSGTADSTKVLYGDSTWKDAPAGTTTFTGLTDTPSAYTGEGGKFLAVNSGATAVELVDAPTFTLGDSAASLSEVKLSSAQNVPTTTVGAWTSWATLLTSSALTHAGVMDITAVIRGNITTDTTGGGDRVYVETRLVRTRSSVDTEIDWSMMYIRNGGNFGTQALEDASQMFEKDLNVNDTGVVGDTYKIEYRVISQGNLHTVQFTTDSKIQVVNPGSGGSSSGGGAGLTDAQEEVLEDAENLQEVIRSPGAFLVDGCEGRAFNNYSITFTTPNAAKAPGHSIPGLRPDDNDSWTQIKIGTVDWVIVKNSVWNELPAVSTGTILNDTNSIALNTGGTIYRVCKGGGGFSTFLSSSVAETVTFSMRRYQIKLDKALLPNGGDLNYVAMTQTQYDALAVKVPTTLYLIR